MTFRSPLLRKIEKACFSIKSSEDSSDRQEYLMGLVLIPNQKGKLR